MSSLHRVLAGTIALGLLLQLVHLCQALAPPTTGRAFLREEEHWSNASDSDRTVKKNVGVPVLGYVTPWNTAGQRLVTDFRDKFDLVAPVWYTILVSDSVYTLSGAPTKEATAWAEDVQRSAKVLPRFYLDHWTQNDYADLLSNTTLWTALADIVMKEVDKHKYDGIVLESAATYLLFEPVSEISRRLHEANKTLVVVLPPIRTAHSLTSTAAGAKRKPTLPSKTEDAQNRMILQSLPQLASVVDWFSVMTYDMSSAGGRPSGLTGDDFPEHSPLRMAKRDNLRQPGPNTSPIWISENVDAIVEAMTQAQNTRKPKQSIFGETSEEMQDQFGLDDASNPFNYEEFGASKEDEPELAQSIVAKLLMGMPMYGYKYPIFFIDRSEGQGVRRSPARSVEQAEKMQGDRSVVPFLRGPGEALTIAAISEILHLNEDAYLTNDKKSGESWFDYTEEIAANNDQHGVRQGDEIYWRVYMPTRASMVHRLGALAPQNPDSDKVYQAGVSLWEVGQASASLLVDL